MQKATLSNAHPAAEAAHAKPDDHSPDGAKRAKKDPDAAADAHEPSIAGDVATSDGGGGDAADGAVTPARASGRRTRASAASAMATWKTRMLQEEAEESGSEGERDARRGKKARSFWFCLFASGQQCPVSWAACVAGHGAAMVAADVFH